MYTREKLCRDQNYESRKGNKNPPSFSATLLDEIYRSTDGNVDESEAARRRRGGGGGYEEIASFRRACMVEKWMEKEKSAARKKLRDSAAGKPFSDSDLIFFSSTSSSSDSSGALSSSDTEFFASTRSKPPKVSCFTAKPKPVRTGGGSAVEDDSMKSKSRALKIYANLKKVKQPISPGGRLTTFINSLFSNASSKKSRSRGAAAAESPAAPSSASSFSRSCLSKNSPRSREKMRSGPQRTVRFEQPAVSVADEESRPFSGRFPPPLPELKMNKKTIERVKADSGVKSYNNNSNINSNSNSNCNNYKREDIFFNDEEEEEEEEDDEDCLSDSSSDLFELDHLSLFGADRYSEELPVYETTHFDTNRAIASGMIR